MEKAEVLKRVEKANEKAKTLSGRAQNEMKQAAGDLFRAWMVQDKARMEEAALELDDLFAYYRM